MSLDYVWQLLRQRWLLAVSIMILVAGGVSVWSLTRTPVYTASADVYVTIAPDGGSSSLYQDSQYVLGKIASYTQIATTPLVLDPVEEKTGLDGLGSSVTATNIEGTSIINVAATSASPADAAEAANEVATQLAPVITGLEPTSGASTVKVTTVRAAVSPSAPTFPRNTLNIGLGVLAGLLLGAGAAIAVGRLDRTVRTGEDIEAVTGASPLGTVRKDPNSRRQPLPVLDPSSKLTEDYRSIRARLAFANVDNKPRRIAVTSAIPGDGKSTVSINLALVLAQTGARVCFVEADVRRPMVSTYLGIDGSVGLTDVLVGTHSRSAAMVEWGDGLLSVLPAGTNPPDPGELFASRQMHQLLEELAHEYDYLICDTPPLLAVADATVIAPQFDGLLIVARHGHVTKDKFRRAVEELRSTNTKVIGTVLNAVPRRHRETSYDYSRASTSTTSTTSTGSTGSAKPALR